MSEKVQFALFSPQAGQSWHQLEERAHRCEKLGYHSIWLVDHMWSPGMPDLDHHECLTLMAGLAAKTEKIRIGTLVMCNSYRNPALLAKALCTIDHISNGRLEVGYGAGWMAEEYKGYGYEFPSMSTRLKMFEEGLHIMKLMFTEKKPSFTGRHYSINEATCNPKPVQQPHPPITIGGSGEKVMLKLVARFADRWNCPAGYQSFEHKFNVLKQHCKDVGRDVKTLPQHFHFGNRRRDHRHQGHAQAANRGTEEARRDGHHDLYDFLQRLRAAADARAVRQRGHACVCID